MTLVPERVLASLRLGRFIGRDDVADCSAAVHAITDPAIRELVAKGMRLQAFEEIFDVISEPGCSLNASQIVDLTQRAFAGSKAVMGKAFPADIVDQAFAPPGGDA